MTEAKSILFDNFYFISELLNDDLDDVAEFMKLNTKTKLTKQRLLYLIENARYEKIESEINQCLDLGTLTYKMFVYKKQMHQRQRQLQFNF